MPAFEPEPPATTPTIPASVQPTEDVGVIEAAFADWNEARIDLVAELYAKDSELDFSAVMSGVGPIRGRPRVADFWRTLRTNWPGLELEVAEIHDLGRRRYVADCRLRGAESSQRLVYVFTIGGDRLIARCQLAPDVEAAIELAGGAAG